MKETEPHILSRLHEFRAEALDILRDGLRQYGHFPVLEYYPDYERRKHKGWHFTYASPFLHANVMYALLNAGYGGKDPLLQTAAVFLRRTKEPGDLWRFWDVDDSEHPIPCGVDDTALCSLVLTKLGDWLRNRPILTRNIRPDGSILTWIKPGPALLFTAPAAYFNLKRKDKKIVDALTFDMFDYGDAEPATAANVLAYLGDTVHTKNMAAYIGATWLPKTAEHYQFYDHPVAVAYQCARAFREGVVSLAALKMPILAYVAQEARNFVFTERLMAYLALAYYSGEERLKDELKNEILAELSAGKAFDEPYAYVTSKDRVYYGGGPCWTAALFLEASKEWE